MSSLVTPELKAAIKHSTTPGTHKWNGQGHLSSIEKDRVVILDGLLNELQEYISESVRLNRDKATLADMKRAHTLLDKALCTILQSLDPRPLHSLICMLESHRVFINRREHRVTEGEIAVSKADMEKCGFIMLTYCDNCPVEVQRDYTNCDLHWFLTGTFGDVNRGGVCPFAEKMEGTEVK
jgi:hypothetical protein